MNFRGERRSNVTHQSATDPEAKLAKKGSGQGGQALLLGQRAGYSNAVPFQQVAKADMFGAAGDSFSKHSFLRY